MNTIRKIITERLENAKLDYCACYEELDTPLFISDKLAGQIEAYQDCLNLMQHRTEQEILKDFEKLGYSIENSYNHPFVEMSKYNEDYCIYEFIVINKGEHNYEKYVMGGDVTPVTMQEHKLLNELFIIWGWL